MAGHARLPVHPADHRFDGDGDQWPCCRHPLLGTNADPTGTRVFGTLANCAGGVTAWGTVLSGEESVHFYFGNLGNLADDDPARPAYERYQIAEGLSLHEWETFYPRYDAGQEPNEAFRFGWVIEVDLLDPASTPKKRTALGRIKHEDAYGFRSQGEALPKTRLAADAVGATRMDRPKGFETNPVTGKVSLSCTDNSRRTLDQVDSDNPRPNNFARHIIEITESGNDHAATTFTGEIFIFAGDPATSGTWYGEHEGVSPCAAPDNLMFDLDGNIWISTDGVPDNMPGNDGLFVAPAEGEERGLSRSSPSALSPGSGPVFTPDNTTFFVSVQHPGEGSTLDDPSNRWPDGDVPRPSVVLITHKEPGQRVGRAT